MSFPESLAVSQTDAVVWITLAQLSAVNVLFWCQWEVAPVILCPLQVNDTFAIYILTKTCYVI